MATAVLVDRDLELGRQILTALKRSGIPISVAFWARLPELEEWQLFIATPLVDSKGPRSAYAEVLSALRSEEFDPDLPWRRIFLRSPRDPVLKSLERLSRSFEHEGVRVVNAAVGDRFVEDSYMYTGWIDVLQLSPSKYAVTYVVTFGGGSLHSRNFQNTNDVREFLEREIGIRKEEIAKALADLAEGGHASIPNVVLKKSELKKLGVA